MKIIKYIFESIFVYFLFLIVKIFGLSLGRKIIVPLFLSFGFFFKSKKVVKAEMSGTVVFLRRKASIEKGEGIIALAPIRDKL